MVRRLYDWMLAKAAQPQAERWLFAFAFAESSFFPIPPHPLLGLMCLANPARALRYGIITTAASVLGGLFGYAIGYFAYGTIGVQLLQALGLWDSFPQAACYLRAYGAEIILIKGATPIPFKLLTLTAGFIGMNLGSFILASIASRAFQFMLVGFLFWRFGAPIKAFVEKYLAALSAAFALAVVGGFIGFALLSGGGTAAHDACSAATHADLAR